MTNQSGAVNALTFNSIFFSSFNLYKKINRSSNKTIFLLYQMDICSSPHFFLVFFDILF